MIPIMSSTLLGSAGCSDLCISNTVPSCGVAGCPLVDKLLNSKLKMVEGSIFHVCVSFIIFKIHHQLIPVDLHSCQPIILEC